VKYYIYQLTTNDTPFYVGRTIDPKRREAEHRRGSLTGTELKYEFIRELTKLKQAWQLEILAEYSDNLYPYEDYYIYELLKQGYELTNMRKGDIYTEAEDNMFKSNKTFITAKDFFEHRAKQVAALKIKHHRLKKEVNYDLIFSGMSSPEKQVPISKGLQAIRDRKKR